MNLNPILAAVIPLKAQSVWEETAHLSYLQWLTNSIFVCCVVTIVIVVLARRATAHMTLVPSGSQNAFEAVVQGLYEMLEGIVGKHMIAKVFSLLASLFIFILVANWFGLLPGVGSVGWGHKTGFLTVEHVEVPLLRPATADVNLTLALSVVFMVMWLVWSLQEVGAGGMVKHIFGVKGGLKGALALALLPIFLGVGVIEVVSIIFRPVALTLRLFGNIYAGENLLTAMITLGTTLGMPAWLSYIVAVIVPIPFYFLELLVGVLQALVFMLLCAVYIQLATTHDDESH